MKRYIKVSRSVIQKNGIDAAVILGELEDESKYWSLRRFIKDGWFCASEENILSRTGIKKSNQLKAIKALSSEGLLEYKIIGKPPMRYFKINFEKVKYGGIY